MTRQNYMAPAGEPPGRPSKSRPMRADQANHPTTINPINPHELGPFYFYANPRHRQIIRDRMNRSLLG